ncbi:Uncharacterised protein [Achromobacter xylosoxidans]|nr:Uncharacterised protein [Achromobacter xylosoxidans]
MRHRQRHRGVLLDQQHRHALLAVDARDDGKNGFHQHRRQPQRRLVQQHQLGLRDQRPPDRQHLLLTAGKIARQAAAAFVQPRKISVHQVEIGLGAGPAAERVGRGHQVLLDRQILEHAPSFHHMRQPGAHQVLRPRPRGVAAVEQDAPARQLAILQVEQARHRLQRRRLTGAVAAQQGHDGAGRHRQRQAAQHLHRLVVDHLDVVDVQHRRRQRSVSGIHGRLTAARSSRKPAPSASAWYRRDRYGPPESNCP